ncbi:hypothetical protein [Deinococcus cellulosilyticus]|nr:hypothetical protein [Deinococcus cellulosilyticus]
MNRDIHHLVNLRDPFYSAPGNHIRTLHRRPGATGYYALIVISVSPGSRSVVFDVQVAKRYRLIKHQFVQDAPASQLTYSSKWYRLRMHDLLLFLRKRLQDHQTGKHFERVLMDLLLDIKLHGSAKLTLVLE